MSPTELGVDFGVDLGLSEDDFFIQQIAEVQEENDELMTIVMEEMLKLYELKVLEQYLDRFDEIMGPKDLTITSWNL